MPHMRPCAPRQRVKWMGNNPPSKRISFLGLLRVFMALKTLRCCGDSSLPKHRSALRAINTLNPPKNYIRKLGGLLPIHSTHWHRAKSLMWGARGPFHRRRPWLWRLWCQLCFVLKLLNKEIKTLKLVGGYQKVYLYQYIVKHIVIHTSLIVAWPKPKLWRGRSPNHLGPMDPGILGIAGKLLSLQEWLTHWNEG